jgi:hypothetical protein
VSLTALCSTEWLIEERSRSGTELFVLAWRTAPKYADMRQGSWLYQFYTSHTRKYHTWGFRSSVWVTTDVSGDHYAFFFKDQVVLSTHQPTLLHVPVDLCPQYASLQSSPPMSLRSWRLLQERTGWRCLWKQVVINKSDLIYFTDWNIITLSGRSVIVTVDRLLWR